MQRKPPPVFAGHGQMRFSGHQGPAQYSIAGDPAKLRMGPARLRGSIHTTPELAHEAFRAGEGLLSLEDGAEFRMTMLGHSAGGGDVYIEIRV